MTEFLIPSGLAHFLEISQEIIEVVSVFGYVQTLPSFNLIKFRKVTCILVDLNALSTISWRTNVWKNLRLIQFNYASTSCNCR